MSEGSIDLDQGPRARVGKMSRLSIGPASQQSVGMAVEKVRQAADRPCEVGNQPCNHASTSTAGCPEPYGSYLHRRLLLATIAHRCWRAWIWTAARLLSVPIVGRV